MKMRDRRHRRTVRMRGRWVGDWSGVVLEWPRRHKKGRPVPWGKFYYPFYIRPKYRTDDGWGLSPPTGSFRNLAAAERLLGESV